MKMQTAITTKQAREICKGRTPLIPVEYETAVKALTECVTLDEAKYWDNKADALAAWAKIYHSSEAERKAKQLKLHAYRRMGEIAGELRPVIRRHGGSPPGPVSLLREYGFTKRAACVARRIASMPQRTFQDEIERSRIRSPDTVFGHETTGELARAMQPLFHARSVLRRYDPKILAGLATERENNGVITCVRELIDWLDAFDQALPRAKP